jgi:hypothetical protein
MHHMRVYMCVYIYASHACICVCIYASHACICVCISDYVRANLERNQMARLLQCVAGHCLSSSLCQDRAVGDTVCALLQQREQLARCLSGEKDEGSHKTCKERITTKPTSVLYKTVGMARVGCMPYIISVLELITIFSTVWPT